MIQEISNVLRKQYEYRNKDDRQRVGIGGYNLDVRISDSINFISDVPENIVEDGSSLNDHIIIKPIEISIEGEVADIKLKEDFLPILLDTAIDKTADLLLKLKPIRRTIQQLEKIEKKVKPIVDAYKDINDLIEQGQEVYDFFTGQKTKTEQDNFFDFMEFVYENKLLITIEMPFRNYENMRITSLVIVKDNETNQRLRYKLSAKEIKFAVNIYANKSEFQKIVKKPTRSTESKTASKESKGLQEPTTQKKSLLSTILGG